MDNVYVINLRHALKSPRTKRAAKATAYIRSFVKKMVKEEDVFIDPSLNRKLWEKGIKNAPNKVKVKVVAQEEGGVLVIPV